MQQAQRDEAWTCGSKHRSVDLNQHIYPRALLETQIPGPQGQEQVKNTTNRKTLY